MVHNRAEQSVVFVECGLVDVRPRPRRRRPAHAACASPMVSRRVGRARTSPHPRRGNFRSAARCLRVESPCGRTYATILGQTDRFTHTRAGCSRQCQRSRILICNSPTIGGPRAVQHAPVERRTMDVVAGCRRSSLPGAATALHHASARASAGQDWLLLTESNAENQDAPPSVRFSHPLRTFACADIMFGNADDKPRKPSWRRRP